MKRERLRRGVICSLVISALLVGCTPSYGEPFLRSFAEGARAYHAGRYVEAARAYGAAADKAQRIKDRDEARFLEGRCYERAGKFDDAESAYRRLIADSPEGPRTARASFMLGEIAIERGDEARGYALLDEATRRFPNHGVTRPMIRRIADHVADEQGEEAALTWLRSRIAVFKGTEQEQMIEYEIALSLERLGKHAEAHDDLLATARAHPYPFGGLTDDALFRAAEIDVELGRPKEAVRHLRELLAPRETAGPPASYDRPRFVAAELRIAELLRDELHDREAAIAAFSAFVDKYPHSTKRDDALWEAILLSRESGDEARVCRFAERLVHEFEESRYVPCAPRVCPSVKASASKRSCADYIARELEEKAESTR